jgi:predicted transcriptional regulator
VTQHELAEALGVAQSNISRIEHEDDPQVSTIRKFVEALGGELVLQAKIGDEMIDLMALATT